MRLSGTSFAAPVVAGVAAQILARHPIWTPDQVKGALMLTARSSIYIEGPPAGSVGVGEVYGEKAAAVTNPPNPNLGLNRFLGPDPNGGAAPVFNAASWESTAKANASWDSVSWSDVSWSDASWESVSWSDVSWTDVSWTDVSWSDNTALADVSWEDAAGLEVGPRGGDYLPAGTSGSASGQ
jgi:subtilisin family serine protease